MKILLLNQFFWPDTSATSQLLTDLARGLQNEGHEVTVICSAKGYTASVDSNDAPQANVVRLRSLRFVRGTLGRIFSYLSFYLLAAWHSLLLPRPDVVLTLTTPPLLSLLGTLLKKLRGTTHVLWEMDVYPDVAVALGYFKADGIIDRTVGALADYSRKKSDRIIALAGCMRSLLVRRGIPAEKISVVHNWADASAILPLPLPGKAGDLTVLYSGNLGLAHDVETVRDSIASLQDDPGIRFIFSGGGAHRQDLERWTQEHRYTSVSFRAHVDRESLSASLSSGDVGLVTQRQACCGAVVPSKVYGLLAAGRPYIFVGPAEAAPAVILDTFACGWHIAPGDSESLSKLLLHLKVHRDEIAIASANARRAAVDHFDLPKGVAQILYILNESGGARTSPRSTPSLSTPDYEKLL